MPKNLLFITTDQQRFDSLKAYGFVPAKTPNIDRLVREGTTFDNCYVPSPVCVACRSAMMTGLFASVTGTLGNAAWLEDYIPTWPGLAAAAGIRSAGIGKMHFAPWDVLSGFSERIICEDKRHYYIPDDHYMYLKANGKKRLCPPEFPKYKEFHGAAYYPYSNEYYPDTFIADRAAQWLESNSDEPFATWVSFIGPHDPYDPPEEFKDLYSIDDMPDPIPVPEYTADKTAYNLSNEERPGKCLSVFQCDYMAATDEQKKRWRKHYMTNLSVIDEGLGRIFKVLDEKGIWDDTTIVFTSDHGDALGDHGTVFKMYFYEPMVHVPLIIKGPGVPAGERRSGLVSTCDLVPYFCEVLGIEPPKVTQGVSVGNLIREPEKELHEAVFADMEGYYMVFDGRYKLSYYVGRIDELYDLKTDPNELVNQIANPEYAACRERLMELLLRHLDDNNRKRTDLSKKVASERRPVINKAYAEGKDIFSLTWQD